MPGNHARSRLRRLVVVAAAALVVGPLTGLGTAGADEHAAASAFGATVTLGGNDVIPPTPSAEVAAPPAEASETVIDIPAEPVIINGTLTATAIAHTTADLESALTVVEQELPGPYSATALAEIEEAGVLYEVAGEGVPLLSAALIRAEAVAVCGPTPQFSASSEIIDLAIGGEQLPLNDPVQEIIDGITTVLAESGLNAVVDVQRNVVTPLAGGGVGVDALVVTVLAAAGDDPLAQIRLAHAEVTPDACAAAPECSDGVDNDGDGVIDADDPGCHTDGDATNPASYDPNDDSEADTECSDGVDNDGDGVIDADDPGCHTDGDATNPASYDPSDDDESNARGPAQAAELPKTGSDGQLPAGAAALMGLGLAAAAVRRRLAA
jgi:LPXTG-motif cell wall-anchored protein